MNINKNFFTQIEIKNRTNKFLPNGIIKSQVDFLFPNLNEIDKNILLSLSIYLITYISKKFYFINSPKYIQQWTQNNSRDIKSAILKILPFIDDKNDFKLFKKIKDLNQILYYPNTKNIPKQILDTEIYDAIKSYFPINNFSLGLLGASEKPNNKHLLTINDNNNNKLIYELIHHNFIALLDSIKVCSSKLYINWINTVPIHENNIYNSQVYKQTITDYNKISLINKPTDYINFEDNYNGVSLDNIYNVFRVGYYKNIKNIKWLIFNLIPDNTLPEPIGKYFIQILDQYLDISNYLDYQITIIYQNLKNNYLKPVLIIF